MGLQLCIQRGLRTSRVTCELRPSCCTRRDYIKATSNSHMAFFLSTGCCLSYPHPQGDVRCAQLVAFVVTSEGVAGVTAYR